MRVAVVSAEAVPFSKTGGLGDVAGALPKALRSIGLDAFLVTPLHAQTDQQRHGVPVGEVFVPWADGSVKAGVRLSEAGGSPAYLIDCPRFFHRSSVYGSSDDHERFAFFCRAAIETMRSLGAAPDVVHLNDWHSGFASVLIGSLRRTDPFWSRTRTVLSIHNLAYQGAFALSELPRLGFTRPEEADTFSFDGSASALKAGVQSADMLSTVSRRYAREIQQPEHGNGLDWLLRGRSGRLRGIVNGIDFEVWDPMGDPALPARFGPNDLSGKLVCREALLSHFGLENRPDRPILASITRLTRQKGVELMMSAAGEVLRTGAYLVSLGSGEAKYEAAWQSLRDSHPGQVGIYRGYNEELSHLIEAGSDIFMMPSLFEPCGLNQMYSLRYGTVPVVRAVGGLDDTVRQFDPVSGKGNGFKFDEFRADRFLEKLYEAMYHFQDRELWRTIQLNGMAEDNSWERAAREYAQLYAAAARL